MGDDEHGVYISPNQALDQNAEKEHPLHEAEQHRAAGGYAFRNGDFETALGCYASALMCLEACSGSGIMLKATLASNQSLCYLKLSRYAEAEERASAALAADASNSKAAYRRGLARLHLADYLGALEDLTKAARLEPQNTEIRQKRDQAKQLADAAPSLQSEVAVARGASGALGCKDGGLYSEKQDLNQGRLAETLHEQKNWVQTISDWTEIRDISFSDDGDKNCVSVYMSLLGVQDIPSNKICVWMTPTTLEVRIVDLRDRNWFWLAQELWGQIDPEQSTWKVRKDKLSLKLHKRASARSWDRWEKIRRI